MTCYISDWTWHILDVLHMKQVDELFQILNLFGKDSNVKGLTAHWNNITLINFIDRSNWLTNCYKMKLYHWGNELN